MNDTLSGIDPAGSQKGGNAPSPAGLTQEEAWGRAAAILARGAVRLARKRLAEAEGTPPPDPADPDEGAPRQSPPDKPQRKNRSASAGSKHGHA